jgi:hypothetical protein
MKWSIFWAVLSLILTAVIIFLLLKNKSGLSSAPLAQKIASNDTSDAIYTYPDVSKLLKLSHAEDFDVLPHSGIISKKDAERLRERYTRYPAENVLASDSSGNQQLFLKFRFKAADIQSILSAPAPNTPKILVVKFGLVFAPPSNVPVWHVIVYGSNSLLSGNLLPAPGSPIFENTANSPSQAPNNIVPAGRANTLMTNYTGNITNSSDKLTTTYPDNTPNAPYALDGYSFDAGDIQQILTSNASQFTPDELVFLIGARNVNGGAAKAWHIIALGSQGGTLLDFSTIPQTIPPPPPPPGAAAAAATVSFKAESIYDKATPCPPCNIP